MDTNTSLQQMFEKLGDLKSFFFYAQKLLPVLQKIIDFMSDTAPLLENVNKSIAESTSKIPKAAVQISNVTSATEVATTEILDEVDGVSANLNEIHSKLDSLKTRLASQKTSIENLTKKYPDDVDVANLITNGLNPETINLDLDMVVATVSKIQERMMNITMSLQVTDITSQQLASVNHLMESVQEKLASLIFDLSEKDESGNDGYEFPRDLTFNADARYDKTGDTQSLVDSLVQQKQIQEKKSQKEIDELFSKK